LKSVNKENSDLKIKIKDIEVANLKEESEKQQLISINSEQERYFKVSHKFF
jgi:hypothetical protein